MSNLHRLSRRGRPVASGPGLRSRLFWAIGMALEMEQHGDHVPGPIGVAVGSQCNDTEPGQGIHGSELEPDQEARA